MRYLPILIVGLFGSLVAADHAGTPKGKPAVLLSGLGNVQHPVSTRSKEAQQFFDQGLALIYAFNHEEAERSFRRAAELDPKLAMTHWGVALALGPNYNLDVDDTRAKAAYAAIQTAQKLATSAPEHEQHYVAALAKRYSADPKADRKKLAQDYKNAMGELTRRYPDDLNAATLYAESMMNLRPWELWGKDGKPAEGTEEIVAVLESVLRRNQDHTGANHYYIHAVEASPTPERGLASARRLEKLAPAAGHLVHMPSHIYSRVGDYDAAARSNAEAARADEAYLFTSGAKGVYPLMYYSHNLHFLAFAHAMQGRFPDALAAAEKLVAHVGPHVKDMPMLEGFLPTPTLMLTRFRRWEQILALPRPDSTQKITTVFWHFARGVSLTATGKADEAEKERQAFLAVKGTIPADAPFGDRNKADAVLVIAEGVLAAKIAEARKDVSSAVTLLRKATDAEDALNYIEPPDWYLPVRESLGGLLLRTGDPAEAEKVFRADLERNRRNGRSLFGLRESLRVQKKEHAARMVDLEFRRAWRNAVPVELKIEDL